MKRIILSVVFFQLLYQCCFAQEVSIKSETGNSYFQYILDYLAPLNRTDLYALNSIIEFNGIVHPRDTYGYISYINTEGDEKKCVFLHMGGIIVVSKKDFDEILKLSNNAKVEIAICLQSPVNGDWGGYWDKVMVKGSFDAGQLFTTRRMLSPCFHFIITTIGKKYFKFQFNSWETQTCYYSANSCPLTAKQRKRLDRKEHNIYKRANLLDFGREIW